MSNLTGNHICLRALEPEDIDFLYHTENSESIWSISHTVTPYAKHVLQKYLSNAHLSIYETKQVRFVIEEIKTKKIVGLVDLFDFDPMHHRAGVGIFIIPQYQKLGYATDALQCICKYGFNILQLHQLYANIGSDNIKSIGLFEKMGFVLSGIKKDWLKEEKNFKDVLLYQLLEP